MVVVAPIYMVIAPEAVAALSKLSPVAGGSSGAYLYGYLSELMSQPMLRRIKGSSQVGSKCRHKI